MKQSVYTFKLVFIPVIILIISLCVPDIADGAVSGKHFKLDNGLNVFIKEMTAAPVVAINIWVRVGSRNEGPNEKGFSHFVEHMLFKGTPTYPTGQLDKEIKKLGASQNAFTSLDYTCFYVVGAKEHFSRLLELEADAILHSLFDPEEFKKEKEVILEELRRSKDSPHNFTSDLLRETAYTIHPYKHPIIGYEETLNAATRDDLFNFYKKFYVPANMWVIIVGDVKAERALEEVKKFFGGAPNVSPPIQEIPIEPEQTARKEVQRFGDIKQAYVRFGWHAPGIESPDNYVLDVISSIMGGGRSSRLFTTLVEQEGLATDISTGYYTSGDPSLFIVSAELPQSNVRKLIERVSKIMRDIGKPKTADEQDKGDFLPISREELEKAKQQIISNTIFQHETAENQAMTYGHYATLGKLELSDSYIDRIKEVTLEDVRRVANNIFRDSNMTVVRYEPAVATSTYFPEMLTLENGLRLILKENHSSPIVAMAIQIDAGGLREGKNDAGLAHLTAETLRKGTKKRKAIEIEKEFESMGTIFSTKANKSFATIKMVALSEKFQPSLDLALEILLEPEFPEEEFVREQQKAIEAIKGQEDKLFHFTFYNVLSQLFPDHPLGYSPLGLVDNIKNLKRSDLVQFHKKNYVAKGMVVSIVGDFFVKEMKEMLISKFSNIPKGDQSEIKEPKTAPIQNQELVLQKNREQAQIIFATRTFPRSDPRTPAMDVLKNILSGSMNCRLFTNLRDKESLAYEVFAANVGTKVAGYFFASIGTAVNKADLAKRRLVEELESVRVKGVTDEEIADAKAYIIGQHALSLVDNISQADTFASDEFFGLGFDYSTKYPDLIKKVTNEEVKKVADEFMAVPGTFIIGITKP